MNESACGVLCVKNRITMDEDQPATQPHMSPAEQAAQEEARLKTADDSFVSGQNEPVVATNPQSASPSLSTAKKVVIQPVNDLSSYSTAPSIPVAAAQPSSSDTLFISTPATPQAATVANSSVNESVETTPNSAIKSGTYNTPTHGHGGFPQNSYDAASKYRPISRVATDIPMLQWFAIALLVYGLYYLFRITGVWLDVRSYIPFSALLILFYMPSVLGIGYAFYYFFTTSLRNASGVLLSQIIIQAQSLVLFLPSAVSGRAVSKGYIEAIGTAIAVIVFAFMIRSQVNALDDASRNL